MKHIKQRVIITLNLKLSQSTVMLAVRKKGNEADNQLLWFGKLFDTYYCSTVVLNFLKLVTFKHAFGYSLYLH